MLANASAIVPVEIKRNGEEGVVIRWSSGEETTLVSEVLRKNCPCAECKEKRGDTTHAKPLTGKPAKRSLMVIQNSIDTELALKEIWGVGNYALGMTWGDGHNSGIYTFSYLRELAVGS